MIHHGFKRGKRVLIILNTGEHVIGKFKESNSSYIELENRKINWSNIRSSTIYKNRTTKRPQNRPISKVLCDDEHTWCKE